MVSVTLKLETPVTAFGRSYDAITLKEPTGGLYARLGEPRIGVYNDKTNSGYVIEQPAVINQYLDRLVDIGDAAAQTSVLSEMSLVDMKRLKDALFSFFDVAAQKAAELKWTPSFSERSP
jgi:hypothetical protein